MISQAYKGLGVYFASMNRYYSHPYCRLLLFTGKVVSDSLRPHKLQHARLPCPSLSSSVCSNSCPLSQWCHPIIFSSVTPFSSCPQSFLASESFPKSQFFSSGGQSIGATASVLPMSVQGWFPLGLTGSISLLSRVFSSTTIKHQFFGAQPSLWSNSHPYMITGKTQQPSDVSAF